MNFRFLVFYFVSSRVLRNGDKIGKIIVKFPAESRVETIVVVKY